MLLLCVKFSNIQFFTQENVKKLNKVENVVIILSALMLSSINILLLLVFNGI